jgi:pimeloyl-ACP methyl ester carboxylesterase
MFANAGLPTLRFDYHGTGNSAGDDNDAARVEAWLASISQAVATLRQTTGVTSVALVGFRLGALLAALVAARQQDIAALVAIAPVVVGKHYVRELRALQMAIALADPPADVVWNKPSREAAGFALSEETLASLSALILPNQTPIAPAILVVDRKEFPVADTFIAIPNATVAVYEFADYATMTLDPHRALVPHQMIETTTRWLVARAATADATNLSKPPAALNVAAMATRTERVVHYQGTSLLAAVITEPLQPTSRAVLMLNAGATHHVGPNRLYVRLARRLADQGCASVRLDLAGIGDSPASNPHLENLVYPASALDDIRHVLSAMQRDYSDIAVLGLCSGAYHSLKAALTQPMVRRAVMINPLTFFWTERMPNDVPTATAVAQAARYRSSLLSTDKWRKLLRGDVDIKHAAIIVKQRMLQRSQHRARQLARRFGIRFGDDLGYDIESIAKRGVPLHFIFAKSDPGLAMLREQAGSAVPTAQGTGVLTIDIVDGADHTFTAMWTHDILLDIVIRRLTPH